MKSEILVELEAIHQEHGILKAEDVVTRAQNKDNPLHDQFEWNDKKAGQQYRLDQARHLIRVAVYVMPGLSEPVKVRVFQSLKSDRKEDGGGYRRTVEILSHEGMRAELVANALEEFVAVKEKYKHIKELSAIFNAIDETAVHQSAPVMTRNEQPQLTPA